VITEFKSGIKPHPKQIDLLFIELSRRVVKLTLVYKTDHRHFSCLYMGKDFSSDLIAVF